MSWDADILEVSANSGHLLVLGVRLEVEGKSLSVVGEKNMPEPKS